MGAGAFFAAGADFFAAGLTGAEALFTGLALVPFFAAGFASRFAVVAFLTAGLRDDEVALAVVALAGAGRLFCQTSGIER